MTTEYNPNSPLIGAALPGTTGGNQLDLAEIQENRKRADAAEARYARQFALEMAIKISGDTRDHEHVLKVAHAFDAYVRGGLPDGPRPASIHEAA